MTTIKTMEDLKGMDLGRVYDISPDYTKTLDKKVLYICRISYRLNGKLMKVGIPMTI